MSPVHATAATAKVKVYVMKKCYACTFLCLAVDTEETSRQLLDNHVVCGKDICKVLGGWEDKLAVCCCEVTVS